MTTFSCRAVIALVFGFLFMITGCATTGEKTVDRPRMLWAGEDQAKEDHATTMGWAGGEQSEDQSPAYWAGPHIAVLPVHNLTGLPAPVKELESLFSDALVKGGVMLLEKPVLDEYMARHRIRYTGGIDEIAAPLIKYETGVEAVFISTLEYYEEGNPPKLALHARLVSAGDKPQILWMESVCMTGLDSPGLLDVGVIEDTRKLMRIAAQRLVNSLVLNLAGDQQIAGSEPPRGGTGPVDEYRSPLLESGGVFTVAVIPFLNLSERPHAGEILPLHFADLLSRSESFRVLEPGVVRRGLLQMRVTMEGGLSKPFLELVLRSTGADLVLTGTVFRYLDSQGPFGEPDVEFSVQVFERESKEIAWSSRSIGRGNDGLIWFDVGKERTACELASGLVQSTIERIREEADTDATDPNQ